MSLSKSVEAKEGLEPLLCSVREGERILGVGHTTFYALINRGEIEVIKIGAKTCVVIASLRKLVAAKRGA